MNSLTKKEFEKLTEDQHGYCISFYLPTHRSGMETLNEQDRLVFKNQLKEAGKMLVEKGWDEQNAGSFLQPAKELMESPSFWRNQTEGLAVFLNSSSMNYYNLPFKVDPYFHIERAFYLRPLIPAFSGDGRYYVLGLNLHQITFYLGNRERLKEIYVEDLAPQRMEEVVGYDYKEKFFQFRSQGYGQAAFHGHGEWKDEVKKDEILRFFREVDKKITQLIGDENIPLMVAGQDYLCGIYKQVNTYPHLLEEFIDINTEPLDAGELHKMVWEKIYVRFDHDRTEKIELINQFHNTPRTSFDLSEIIPAAIEGRVDALFLQQDAEIWGLFDKEKNSVIVEDRQTNSNTSLVNLAVVSVLQNGGKVYEQIAETMPVPFVEMNALYRY
jgi:hypothetical protein